VADRRIASALVVCILMLAAGCARVGPPGGGPPDTTPPEVVSTTPADGAVEVPLDASVRIEFSEDMNRLSVERAFSITPRIDLRNLRWEATTLVATPEEALPESTSFVVRVGESADDYHKVKLEEAFTFAFSTGPTVDSGVIAGEVTRAGEPVEGATVWACARSVRAEDGELRPCRYAVESAADGSFLIGAVAASERPYTLVAFVDIDGDGVYTVAEEEGAIADADAVIAEPGATATGVRIELTDPSALDIPAFPGEE